MDLSSTVGAAYGELEAINPVFCTWRLPHVGGEGARYTAFENVLADFMTKIEPSRIVLEAPLPLPAMNNRRSAFQQITLRGIAYIEAYRGSCMISEIDSLTVRMMFLGHRVSHDVAKKEILRYCHKRGLKVSDHHQSDAALVWLWYQAQMRRAPRIAGPLFQETMQ